MEVESRKRKITPAQAGQSILSEGNEGPSAVVALTKKQKCANPGCPGNRFVGSNINKCQATYCRLKFCENQSCVDILAIHQVKCLLFAEATKKTKKEEKALKAK